MNALEQVLSIASIKAEHPRLYAIASDELAVLRGRVACLQGTLEYIAPLINPDRPGGNSRYELKPAYEAAVNVLKGGEQ